MDLTDKIRLNNINYILKEKRSKFFKKISNLISYNLKVGYWLNNDRKKRRFYVEME
jgi:hypothetical protein